MPTTGTSALLLKAPSLRARNVLSQDISYALEIFTDTSVTDTDYGVVSGVFRFVTDRPGYIGTVVPKYGPDEIDKDGTPIGGDPISHCFYEGFLLKEWITGNPTRAIDIIITGSYSTDSRFSFKIRNDQKFWDFCNINNINLTGCRVVLWVSIDAVFYQLSRGRVVNNPYTETEYQWNVSDDATLIHKNLPPRLSVLPSADTTIKQSDPIPVVFGNVAKSKILKLSNAPGYLDIMNHTTTWHKYAAATKYTVSFSVDISTGVGYGKTTANLWLLFSQDTTVDHANFFAAHELKGKYVGVVQGDDCNTQQYYRILDNDATALDPVYTTLYSTKLVLETALINTNELIVSEAVFNSTHIYPTDPSGSPIHSNSTTWWFVISDFTIQTQVSNSVVQLVSDLYIQDSSSSSGYQNITQYISKLSINQVVNSISIISNSVDSSGKVGIYEFIPWECVGFSAGSYPPSGLLAQLNAYNKNTTLAWGDVINDTIIHYMTGIFGPPIFAKTYSKYYLLADFNLHGPNSGGHVYYPQVGSVSATFYDIYFGSMPDLAIASGPISDSFGMSGDMNFNLVPNSAYLPANRPSNEALADFYSMFDYIAQSSGSLTFRKIMEITNTDFINNPCVDQAFLSIGFKQNTPPGNYQLAIKAFGLVGYSSADIINSDLFSDVKGETVGNAGTIPTNNIYTTFKHILEDYDGIPSALIDYGNLATRRNDWYTARTVTEQKNSVSYLGELCAHGFVGMFTGRTGKRVLRDILTDGVSLTPTMGEGKTPVHNKSLILRDSISSFKKTDDSQIYNSFRMQYQYDQGSQKFTRSLSVANVDQSSFPASGTADPNDSTIPKWWSYFSGLPVSASDWTLNYTDSKAIWDLCHASYLLNKVVRTTQNDLSELPWFVDTTVFTATDTTGSGISCAAYKLLKLLSQWTTIQKYVVSYSIPLTAETYGTELLDVISFTDDIYTNGDPLDGFIMSIEVDPSGNQLNLQAVLIP